jgi:dTDP-4-amino-4,6-dideoxygalactose transaminase
MINVTKTYLPDIQRYSEIVKRAFDSSWLTNRGELVLELEGNINNYLGVEKSILMANGTIPLQIALQLLAKKGEVITTPFSYVATTSSIIWEGCTPVFADIDPVTWTIDPKAVEKLITERTTAILATHVFGNPCDVTALKVISEKYKLPVIYDGAHAFGVTYKGYSLLSFGDVSTCSFHATKLFHCGEGGLLVASTKELHERCFHAHNFGHNGPEHFHGVGINGKMSELHAAMGLSILPDVDQIIEKRKQLFTWYKKELSGCVQFIQIRPKTEWNYAYCPVLFANEDELLIAVNSLNKLDIFPRRYFYPSLNTLPYVAKSNTLISENISSRILCLPMSHDLTSEEVQIITSTIRAKFNS